MVLAVVVVAIVGLSLFLAIGVSAVVVATNPYNVSETKTATLEEVLGGIVENGPKDCKGGDYAGCANIVVVATPTDDYPHITGSVADQNCPHPDHLRYTAKNTLTIDDTWSINTTITLPAWTDGYSDACAEVQAEWDRFLAALTTHENEHDTIAAAALKNANPASSIIGEGSDCDQNTAMDNARADLTTKVNAENERVIDAVDVAGVAYDAANDHGAIPAPGAVLDTDIVCCGNSQIDPSPPEECDPPAVNSAQCTQTNHCEGLKWCVYADGFGDCSDGCQCSYNTPTCSCITGLCGAKCASDADCPQRYRCNNCTCVGPFGGISESPEIAGPEAATSEAAGTNYTLWMGIAVAGAVGAVVLGTGLWYARRRRLG